MPNFFKKFFSVLVLVLLVSVSLPLQAQMATSVRSLGIGSRGVAVLDLQRKLQQQGYFPATVKPTGYFGRVTRQAVLAFQKANHLPMVGIFGHLTITRLAQQYNKPLISKPEKMITTAVIPSPAILPTPAPAPAPQPELTPTPVTSSQPMPTPASVVITGKAKSALPLYIYPSPGETNWQTAINAGSGVDFIIANVYNGPDTLVKTNWSNMISKAVAAGIEVYGYVPTNYTKVSGDTVDKNVSLWLQFYPQISGFFFDEVTTGPDKLSYYKARYDYVKNINYSLKVVINPGTNTDEGYMGASDVNVIFESPYSSWLTNNVPVWVSKYPKDRFYNIVYSVPTEANMKEVVRVAKEKNFGRMFITSASGPSGALPSYFQSELSELAK